MDDLTALHRIAKVVQTYPDRPALELGSRQWTYKEIWKAAGDVAQSIREHDSGNKTPVALFATRSFATYAGILGILRSGRAYLPINLKFPVSRATNMLKLAQSTVAIVGKEFEEYVGRMNIEHSLPLRFIGCHELPALVPEVESGAVYLEAVDDDVLSGERSPIAYLLFTSGTTGEPKGIPVSHRNLDAYIDYILTHYEIGPDDRCSQAFDTTFDPSAHDIFVSWSAGACLCPLAQNDLLLPNRFITEKRLTVWYSVPSIALRMKQVRMLKPNSFPLLRYSIFSGEGLPDHIAASWKAAAPQSRIVNYYGPTEVTINITEHEWEPEVSPAIAVNGIAPIGRVFPTHRYRIVDEQLHAMQKGLKGELLVAGPQVTKGYLNNPERTAQNYINIDGEKGIWYRTGDLVRELEDGTLQFFGRIDHQVQIRGFRVEIGEVESLLRHVDGVTEAIVLPLEDSDGMVYGLHAFLLAASADTLKDAALRLCRDRLPEYMVPTRLTVLTQFPTTTSGKIDRKQLLALE